MIKYLLILLVLFYFLQLSNLFLIHFLSQIKLGIKLNELHMIRMVVDVLYLLMLLLLLNVLFILIILVVSIYNTWHHCRLLLYLS
jgi:hypothetical protein